MRFVPTHLHRLLAREFISISPDFADSPHPLLPAPPLPPARVCVFVCVPESLRFPVPLPGHQSSRSAFPAGAAGQGDTFPPARLTGKERTGKFVLCSETV